MKLKILFFLMIAFNIGTGVSFADTANTAQPETEKGIVAVYKAIENGVVAGYKAVENFFVSGYQAIENRFVRTFLAAKKAPDVAPTESN
jgi:hypothetical protein